MPEHVVRIPTPPFKSASGALEVHQIPSHEDNLIYLLVCTKTGEAAAIDGPEAGSVLAYCEAQGLTLSAVFNTHTHWDHIGINQDLGKRGLLDGLRVVGSVHARGSIPGLTEAVGEGGRVRLGASEGRVMLTEGHMNGHISYVFEDLLFCGDTLFAGGCGYLFDGPPAAMYTSLQRLAALDPETRVCCAHEYTQDNLRFAYSVDPDNLALVERIRRVWALRAEGRCAVPSTIEEERETNPFVRADSAATFAARRALKDGKAYKALGDGPLPL